MKTNIGIYIAGIALFLTACYKDKGEYTYRSINELSLTFSPATELDGNAYIFALPQKDTLYFELTPIVEQTDLKGESNLEYRWVIPNGKTSDTVYTKSYTFKFPPRKTKSYMNVLFGVKDLTTGLEVYQNMLLRTIVPFLNSWLILHGEEGDRKIAALEYDDSQTHLQRQVMDIYEALNENRRFQDAFALDFTSEYSADMLFILEPDSAFTYDPFMGKVLKTQQQMLPLASGAARKCYCHHPGNNPGIIDENGRFFHSGSWGYFYNAKINGDFQYQADQIYVSADRYYTMWDNVNKRFMYYNGGMNWYKPYEDSRVDESTLMAPITLFPPDIVTKINASGKNVLWMGRGLTQASASGASVLLQDIQNQVYSMIHIGYGGKDKAAKGDDKPDQSLAVDTLTLLNADFDKDSRFASTYAFSNQLFYSLGNEVYLYNLVTRESTLLYAVDEGGKITKLAFRLEDQSTADSKNAEKILGIAVETPEGKGEFYEIFLDEAGDVVQSEKYEGFGKIVDFVFTHIVHRKYELI